MAAGQRRELLHLVRERVRVVVRVDARAPPRSGARPGTDGACHAPQVQESLPGGGVDGVPTLPDAGVRATARVGGGARGSRSCCWQMFTATPGTKKAADQGRGAGSSGRSRCRAAACPGTASQAGRPRAIAAAGTATLRAANTAAGGVVGRAHSRFPRAQQQPLFAAGRAGRAMDARSPPPRPRSLVREPDLPRFRPGRPRATGPGARGARGNGSASAGATTAKASPQSGALARAHGQRLGWREQRRLPTQLRRLPRSPKLCASMASGAVEAARAAKRRRSARLEPRGKIAGRLRCACSAGGARASGVAVGAHE